MNITYGETEIDEFGNRTKVEVEGVLASGDSWVMSFDFYYDDVVSCEYGDTEVSFTDKTWDWNYIVPLKTPITLEALYKQVLSKIFIPSDDEIASEILDAQILSSPYMTGRV